MSIDERRSGRGSCFCRERTKKLYAALHRDKTINNNRTRQASYAIQSVGFLVYELSALTHFTAETLYMYITDHGEQPKQASVTLESGLLRLYCKPLYRTGDTSTVRADAC